MATEGQQIEIGALRRRRDVLAIPEQDPNDPRIQDENGPADQVSVHRVPQ